MYRFVRPVPVFFAVCLIGTLAAYRTQAFTDAGCLWHVVVGERILTGGFMTTDPFTFPFAGQHWIPQQWLAEVTMALLNRAGGFDALLLGFAVGVALTFTMIFRRLLAGGMGVPPAALVAALALVCAGFHFYARPHMFTVGLMAVTAAFVVDFDRGRIGLGKLFWLVPIYVVWTNLHGGMLGGLGTVGLAAVGWLALFLLKKTSPITSWPVVLGGGLLLLLLTASMLVNPFGPDLQRTWFKIVGSPAMVQYVNEHKPLNLLNPYHRPLVFFMLLYIGVLAGAKRTDWRVTWLLPLVWLLLTIKSNRQGPLFVVVAAVVLADIWPHTFWYRWFRTTGDLMAKEPAPVPLRWPDFVLPAVIVALCVGLQAAKLPVPVIGYGWAAFDVNEVPIDLKGPVEDYARSAPPGTRIYNDANYGGFLIYFAPELRIFMDDRFELCGDAWIDNYVEVIRNHPERFEEWYAEYKFDRALVAIDEPLEKELLSSGKWAVVARGKIAVLLKRVP